MITTHRSLPLAVLIVCTAATGAFGQTVTFKNECAVPLVVQIASVERGVLKREQGIVRAGDVTPKLAIDTDKIVTVYDSRTGRILFRDALKASKTPLEFHIAVDPRLPNRVRMVTKPTGPAVPAMTGPKR